MLFIAVIKDDAYRNTCMVSGWLSHSLQRNCSKLQISAWEQNVCIGTQIWR